MCFVGHFYFTIIRLRHCLMHPGRAGVQGVRGACRTQTTPGWGPWCQRLPCMSSSLVASVLTPPRCLWGSVVSGAELRGVCWHCPSCRRTHTAHSPLADRVWAAEPQAGVASGQSQSRCRLWPWAQEPESLQGAEVGLQGQGERAGASLASGLRQLGPHVGLRVGLGLPALHKETRYSCFILFYSYFALFC